MSDGIGGRLLGQGATLGHEQSEPWTASAKASQVVPEAASLQIKDLPGKTCKG